MSAVTITKNKPEIHVELWSTEDWRSYFHLVDSRFQPADASALVEKEREACAKYRAEVFA